MRTLTSIVVALALTGCDGTPQNTQKISDPAIQETISPLTREEIDEGNRFTAQTEQYIAKKLKQYGWSGNPDVFSPWKADRKDQYHSCGQLQIDPDVSMWPKYFYQTKDIEQRMAIVHRSDPLLHATAYMHKTATIPLSGDYDLAICPADLNADGKMDLVVLVKTTMRRLYGPEQIQGEAEPFNNVYVLLRSGKGAYAAPTLVASVNAKASIAVADMNGDKHPDIVLSGDQHIYELLNDGKGNFVPPTSVPNK